MYSQHLVSPFEAAGSVLKNLRRRWDRARSFRTPYVRRLMMRPRTRPTS